jgi:hypothetical protein
LLPSELIFSLDTPRSSVTHSLLFLIAAIGAMAYYAMWTGLGVMYKTTDKSPRVIFWGRYLEQLLTQPVRKEHSAVCFIVGAVNSIEQADFHSHAVMHVTKRKTIDQKCPTRL